MRTRTRVIAAVVFVPFCLLAFEGYRFIEAYRDLLAGRQTLIAVQRSISTTDALTQLSAAGVEHTRAQMLGARNRLHSSSAVLNNDPLLALAGHLPLVGRQVQAAQRLAALGADLGDAGVQAVGVLDTLRQARDQQGTSLLERLEPTLDAVQPAMTRISASIDEAHRLRHEIPSQGLAGPLARSLATVDKDLPRVDEALSAYQDAVAIAPVVLGYSGPRTYLVLARDSSELVGSGGYDLAFGLVTLDHGRVTRNQFEDTNRIRRDDWPPKDPQNYVTPPPALTRYLLRGWPMSLADTSWWLDFPTSAQQAIQIYHVNTNDQAPIDAVIGIDSYTLESLLRVLGPLQIDQFGITVTADDAIRQELVITNPPPGEVRGDGLDPKQFGVLLGSETFSRLLQLPSSSLSQMATTVQRLVQHRDVAFYDTNSSVQQRVERYGASGTVARLQGSDVVMVADASVGVSKMNLVVQRSTSVDVALNDDGSAIDTITLQYTNPFRQWKQRDPALAAVFEGPVKYFGDYIRVLLPPGAQLLDVAVNGKPPARKEPPTTEAGLAEAATFMALGEDQSATVSFKSSAPNVTVRSGNSLVYRLQLYKQPGTLGGPAAISVHPPAGWKIVSVSLDGHPAGASDGTVATDLTVDRLITVVLAPAG